MNVERRAKHCFGREKEIESDREKRQTLEFEAIFSALIHRTYHTFLLFFQGVFVFITFVVIS